VDAIEALWRPPCARFGICALSVHSEKRRATADDLMRFYLAERERRAGGQIRSARLFTTHAVSKCCGAMTTRIGQAQRITCMKCKQPCEMQQLYIPRSTKAERTSGAWHIKISPSRIAARGNAAEDESLDRWLLLESMIEPIPRNCTERDWAFALNAWECLLDARCSLGDVIRLGNLYHPELGTWTEWPIKKAIRDARRTVLARANYNKRRRIWQIFRRMVKA